MPTIDDWGQGEYEVVAPALVPAAERLVQLAAPRAGERVIDLGAGSGNASVPLAAAGADVTAVDPSLRLLGIAERRAVDAGLGLRTVVGSAESMPLPDRDADLVVSNFGMVFTHEPQQAVAEVQRVLAPGGRLLYTAWLPTGPIFEVATLIREAAGPRERPIAADDPDDFVPAEAVPFDWHEPATFAGLFPAGASITTHAGSVEFAAASAADWLRQMTTHQPMWLAVRGQFDDEARWLEVMERCRRHLEASAPGGDRFAVHSPYVVVEIWPQVAAA